MKKILNQVLSIIGVGFVLGASAASAAPFKKTMIVIFENEDSANVLAQPGFASFAKSGALLTNFIAEIHPSQGNYIALTSGSDYGINHDNPVNLNVSHIGDLLEAKGRTWKVYLENYPGNCFTGKTSGTYVRKHNPFMSYVNIQNNPARCKAHLVNAAELQQDVQAGTLPDYSIYIPDLNNDGHDTGVAYADKWFSRVFAPLAKNAAFMQDMLLVATFDESRPSGGNHIYTALYRSGVIAGSTSANRYDHYSLLKTIEMALGLDNLGQNDARATPISGVWRQQ